MAKGVRIVQVPLFPLFLSPVAKLPYNEINRNKFNLSCVIS